MAREHGLRPFDAGVEVKRVLDAEFLRHLNGILVGADVHDGPAFPAEPVDHLLDGLSRVLPGCVLQAIGDHGDEDLVPFLDFPLEGGDGHAHRVIERRAGARVVIGLCQILHIGDGLIVDYGLDVRVDGIESHKRETVVLVRISVLGLAGGLNGLIGPGQGLVVDTVHRAALVEDEHVVDGGLFHGF